MLLSLNWLRDYVDLPKNLSTQQLAHDLTMSTVEVEKITEQGQQFEKMVVGRIIELKNHNNADKLKIALTDIGQGKSVPIVCGGTNLVDNMLVAVALPGAKVRWHGEGDLVELQETEIRGEKSFGMICAANEIGIDGFITCATTEIADLSAIANIKPGDKLADVFGFNDTIIEIDNKSLTNRPDLWGHYGIARELSAIYQTPLKAYNSTTLDLSQYKNNELKIVVKNKEFCQRYIGCLLKNIKIEKSPHWLQQRLSAVGLRPINNIVDITNYVMLDIGQPTHAFDQAKVSEIIVRTAHAQEKIVTLDGVERELDREMLVIADNSQPVALAGIMGAANSEINDDTNQIILEAANFDAMNIRQTATKLSHRTESSVRFEKSLDLELTAQAINKMISLIKEFQGDVQIVSYVDQNYSSPTKNDIIINQSFLEKKIGQKLAKEDVQKILDRLGFETQFKDESYHITVPSWRTTGDVSIAEDIVEEVARIHGYDNLPEKEESVIFEKAKYQFEFDFEDKVKNYLSLACSAYEVFNYPWNDEKIIAKYQLTSDQRLQLANAPDKNNSFIQNSLIANMLKAVELNARHFDEFNIFELARVFTVQTSNSFGQDELPSQPKKLTFVAVSSQKDKDLFLQVKGVLEKFPIFEFKFIKDEQWPSFISTQKYLLIKVGEQTVGWLGELHKTIKNKKVALFEIDFSLLSTLKAKVVKYRSLADHPAIERDLAFEIDWSVSWQNIQDSILNLQEPLVNDLCFLSEYDLGTKKSLAFRIKYQAEKNLTDQEIEPIENKIIKNIGQQFKANLRK